MQIAQKAKAAHLLAPVLFTATIFLSASLLFFVQPLFTKIVLPLVGGAPAVWTTAMLFFQTVLILGYVYAHLSTKYLPVTAQVGLHITLWAIALLFLPLSVQGNWQFDPATGLAWQTLTLFALGVGMPFAVLSANAPLIQSWYSKSGGPSADDPYFLYGASNLGSLMALLAFPLVAEPLFGATQIGIGWATGFFLLGIFLGCSGFLARNGRKSNTARGRTTSPRLTDYARWMLFAFVPSSLMLAVTTKISTDLGSFPLIWILPLSLFLLTFVLTFTHKTYLRDKTRDILFLISLAGFAIILSGQDLPLTSVHTTVIMLAGFFAIAMKMHHALYAARPAEAHLTIFYVTMSVGGALGGVFNAIIAPVAFVALDELMVTVLIAATVLLFTITRPTTKDITTATIALSIVLSPLVVQNSIGTDATATAALVGFVVSLCGALYLLAGQGLPRFVVIAGVLIVGKLMFVPGTLFQDRSFFGTHRIVDEGALRLYQNGTTVHGAQLRAELESGTRPTPLYYYHPEGPMAQIITSDFGRSASDIGVIGLGVGSLACYARRGQAWQFYEIDTLVDDIARDETYFTFMSSCAGQAPTHIGDARVVLAAQVDTRYDILVIDAYSSNAVPVHLSTNEAIALYMDRLKPGGLLVLHISNRYYDIAGPLGRSAANLGLAARIQDYADQTGSPQNAPSLVAVMAATDADLADLDASGKWDILEDDGGRLWTDDYVNILSALK